ncbi:MAG TPA: undecaprenyl-phosphate glucose phosphotransferase [Xanthobacteraceae bacterium]|nr:undecaprenyl-phosphate glucose phosphotransferase [Xanthobacteraceae bacterium]
MKFHQAQTLASRFDTSSVLRLRSFATRTSLLGAFLLSDFAVIVAMAWATGTSYHLLVHQYAGNSVSYLQLGVLSAIIFVIPNLFRGEYSLPNFFTFRPHLRRSIQLWNVTCVCLLALGFLTQITVVYSRGWIISFYALTICALLALRYAYVRMTVLGSRAGLISAQRIFLVGTGRQIEEFVTRYRPRNFGVNVVGCHFLTPVEANASAQLRKEVLARDLGQVVTGARALQPEAIVLLIPWHETDMIDACADALRKLPVELHLGPEHILDRFDEVQILKVGPISRLQLTRLPLSRLELVEKRIFDVLFASVALLLLTPLLIVTAVLIKLDSPGPVFFLQRRFGFNQQPFQIIKFRSMRTSEDGPVIRQAQRHDPRVTRVGWWLRRFNIDEVPQLINVIKGDMSLVGPRPHALAHDREFGERIFTYARRHNVKPGITGWAQIHGLRGETDTDEKMRARIEHDLHYIDNWSIWLDLQILVRTVISPRSYRNAY